MIVLGIDVHKRSHTIAAADQVGKLIGQITVRANDDGHRELLAWAARRWPGHDYRWAVEDCRHVSGRLEDTLLAAGEKVVRVPPKLTARYRHTARGAGKSDPIDALAVARAALSEPDLPVACHDQISHELKLLTDHRDHLIAERTRIINRLRWHLHRLDPDLDIPARSLPLPKHLAQIHTLLAGQPDTLENALVRELTGDITVLTRRIKDLDKKLRTATSTHAAPLLDLVGCAHLTAAKILAETATITRFANNDRYAAYNGTAPIPASSGNTHRHRLARGGNRQLNAAIHRIAITQIRLPGPGRDYYQRRQTDGKSTKESIRALKRKISRTIYHTLKTMAQPNPATALT